DEHREGQPHRHRADDPAETAIRRRIRRVLPEPAAAAEVTHPDRGPEELPGRLGLLGRVHDAGILEHSVLTEPATSESVERGHERHRSPPNKSGEPAVAG